MLYKYTISRFAITVAIFMRCLFVQAQNLVPNPSFEDTVQCPVGISQMYAVSWYSPNNASPDYFNSCNSTVVGVPNNFLGWESARTGVAYAGIYTARIQTPINYREYIQAQLLDTLIAGLEYYVSFYVSLADSVEYACNNIGAYLSQTPISATNGLVLPYTPQIANTSANSLTNFNGWTLVADTFTASGGEQYLTIGNFNDAANSDTVFFGGKLNGIAYYYTDDVSVTICDIQTGLNEKDKKTFKVYPNPASTEFNILVKEAAIEKYTMRINNLLDQQIFEQKFENAIKINSSDFQNGLYFIEVYNQEGRLSYTGKIVIR